MFKLPTYYVLSENINPPPLSPFEDVVGFMSLVEKEQKKILKWKTTALESYTKYHVNVGQYFNLQDFLNLFKLYSSSSGGILLKNLLIDDLPQTPITPTTPTTKTFVSEMLLLSIAKFFGEPIGYLPEHGGTIVQNILPVKQNSTTQQSTSSSVHLAFHTEQAFHPHMPSYLFLMCLRGDNNAHTLLCHKDIILEHASQKTIDLLTQPLFKTRPDKSFLPPGTDEGKFGPLMSVFNHDKTKFVYDEDLMVGINEEATNALKELQSIVNQQYVSICLEPGDLLIVDNNVAVHGRTPFKAKFDGFDRWLQRAFVVDSLVPSSFERKGRVITTTFA
jgi:L-asparagine oxygenase